MVAGRTRGNEDIGGAAFEDIVDGGIGRADRRHRGLPAFRTGAGVGVDRDDTARGDGRADTGNKIFRMRIEDGRLVAFRRLDAVESRKGLVVEHALDGAQTVRPLGMAGRRKVFQEYRMGVETGSHGP